MVKKNCFCLSSFNRLNGSPQVNFCIYRYSAYEFCMGEHVGTHLDAPYHFNQNGSTVEKIPLNKLIVAGFF